MIFIFLLFLICFAVFFALKDDQKEDYNRFLFFSALGLGPLLLVHPSVHALYNNDPWGRGSAILFLLFLCGFLGKELLAQKNFRLTIGLEKLPGGLFAWVVVLLYSLSPILAALILPLTENDTIQFFESARTLLKSQNLDFYPHIDPDSVTGNYSLFSHPLGFTNLVAASMHLNGGWLELFFSKSIAGAYLLLTLFFIIFVVFKSDRTTGLVAGLLLLATPIYLRMTQDFHLDSFRIFFFLIACAGLSFLRTELSWRQSFFLP